MKALVYQKELCPKTGKEHWQGAVKWTKPRTMKWTKDVIGGNPHLEQCRDWPKTVLYCGKEDTRADGAEPVQFGDVTSGQGKRNDLKEATAMIMAGKSMRSVALEEPTVFVRMHKGLQALQAAIFEPEQRVVQVICLVGETGCGKSRWAHDNWPDLYPVFACDPKATWFDGYANQKVVLFDDVGQGAICNINYLKRLLDRYKMRVPVKGGSVAWNPEMIILTSNMYPMRWWEPSPADADLAALQRRMETYQLPFDQVKLDHDTESVRRGGPSLPSVEPTIVDDLPEIVDIWGVVGLD